ncbi:MAG: CPBP family intramembrane metalloprotease [Archangium sp.]|nr:CPBP family intramembrane metalloprotease [Archangium sp.]
MPSFRFSLVTIVVAFVVFMSASTPFFSLNIAASVVVGLWALGGTTVVALSMTGRDWRTATGLTVFRGPEVAMGALLALGNALSFSDWLGQLSAKVLPQFLLDVFDTSKLLATATTTPLEQVALVVAVVMLAPVAEELLFRGVLVQGLTERLGIVASAVMSGFIFSAYHLDPVGFLPRFEIGIVLALVVWKSGSLWPVIAAHAANNALATVLVVAHVQDDDVPWWVRVGCLVVFLASVFWFWARPTTPRPETRLVAPTPLLRAATPFVLPLVASGVLIAVFDARGGRLTRIDLATPILGKGDEAEEAALLALRAQARRGEADCEEYGRRRRALSQARFKTLVESWLPKKLRSKTAQPAPQP